MQIVGQFFLLLTFCTIIDFQKRILSLFWGFLYMDCVSWFKFLSQTCDFGCGYVVFGCFKQLFNLISLFLLVNLGIKVFQFGYNHNLLFRILYGFSGKSGNLKNNVPFLLEMVKKSEPKLKKSNCEWNELEDESEGLNDRELINVDEVFDVMSLRKMVKREKLRADAAYTELDKERIAAATAADEAMSMILRLQNEKSLIEMESNHHRRLVEEKQNHDQEVIQSLRWIVMRHELERSYLEDQLRVYKRRLKILSRNDGSRDLCEENDERMSFFDSGVSEGSPCDGLISSLDFDLSPP